MRRQALRLAVSGALVAVACGAPPGPREGAALRPAYSSQLRIRPVPPGEEWVLMAATMVNTSPAPIVVSGIHLQRRGLGNVVQLRRVRIAPLTPQPPPFDTTPGGVYKTYPPAILVAGEATCRVQVLAPVAGYVLPPGAEARILTVLRAGQPGRFRITAHVVEYRQRRQRYVQTLPVGLAGVVSQSAEPMRPYPQEQACASETTFLPSGIPSALPS